MTSTIDYPRRTEGVGGALVRRVKLAVVLEATTGGTRRHLYLLLEKIDLRRFEVTLFYSARRGPRFIEDLADFRERGIRCEEIPMTREISPVADAAAFFRLCAALRGGGFDIVHLHSSKAGFLGRLACLFARRPCVIYSPHSFAFQYRQDGLKGHFYLWLERLAGLFHDHFLFVSEDERLIARRHRLAPERTMALPVLPNALCHEKWSQAVCERRRRKLRGRLSIGEDHRIVGMVAHFRPQKGHRHLIEALPRVVAEQPSTRFLLIGDGPLLASAKARVRELDLEAHVLFTGALDDPLPYYDLMDVFVLTSLWEGHPYAILEAFARGLPVVVTRVPGLRDLVVPGENGLTIPIGDSAALAEALLRLLRDDTLRGTLARQAKETFARSPRLDAWASEYEAIYWRALESSRPARFHAVVSQEG
ncbi:MAG: glycosyltransferase [Sumerlaeia bacterium]